MSYDISKDTITVNDVVYDIKREQDKGGSGEETLQVTEFNVVSDEWEYIFPGLEGTLGYEDYIDEGLSPREWSNVGKMACSHDRYTLGDKDIDAKDLLENTTACDRCDGNGYRDFEITGTDGTLRVIEVQCAKCDGAGEQEISIVDYVKKEWGARVIIPLFLYDHSGISMSAGAAILNRDEDEGDFDRRRRHPFDAAGWDVSAVGVIFDTPEGVQQCIGDDATLEQIEAALRSEVEVYSSYLEGDITYFNVQDEETDFHESCGGFVGSHKQCEIECFEALEAAIVKRLGENDERDHWNSRDVPTV